MTQTPKLSLPAAILININIMLGAGIFLNTPNLAQRAGWLGFLAYAFVGLLMLPLILTIAELLRRHPTTGFYGFGASELSPFIGFISTWSYFTSKLGSCTIMIHASVLFIQEIIPALKAVSPFIFDIGIITFFLMCNMLNMKTGAAIQKIFICFKLLPVLFVIICGILFFHTDSFIATTHTLQEFYTTIPLVLYAIMGFEAACSLSNRIENPEKNAPRAVLISFGIVITLSLLYQFFFYTILGSALETAQYSSVFGLFINNILPQSPIMRMKLLGLMQMGIAISALGGAYGIYFTNSLNLLTLAQKKHIFMPSLFAKLNAQAIPYMCILTEGFLTFFYLAITQGHDIPLRQLSAFGCTITYTLSSLALVAALWRNPVSKSLSAIAWLAVCTCLILLASCVNNFMINGIQILYVFLVILIFGTIMYAMTENTKKTA
jgi:APA family basic amino acid/polyamine antiporter